MWRVFWTIRAFSGMRMGEVAHLAIHNIDFGRGIFVIEEGKTGQRIMPIAPNIIPVLRDYIQSLRGSFLFPSRRRGKKGDGCVDSVDWGYNFAVRLRAMGLRRVNLSPYSFRHSFCTRMLEEDSAFPTVMKIMGHKRAETTLQYTHMTTKDVIQAVQKLPLVRKRTSPSHILHSLGEWVRSLDLNKDERFIYSITETDTSLTLEVRLKN